MYFVNQSKKKKHLIKLHIIFLVNYTESKCFLLLE